VNKNSIIAHLIAFSLVGAIFVNVAYVQEAFSTSTVQLRKAASGAATASPSAATTTASSKPVIPKIKITSPTRGQQVSVGKDLTISGTSIDNANSNDCKVSVRVNKVSPYQPAATATGAGGAATKDYSKWNFVLTSKYTTIKPGQNRITAKYECANNPALTSFSSVNVTGVPAEVPVSKVQGTATSIAPLAANVTNQIPQKRATTTTTTPTASALPRPLTQLPQVTNNTSGSSSITATNNIPIVVQPFPGGTCPTGYHLVSGAVCIKDISPTTKPTLSATPTPEASRSFPIPSSATNQPNANSANNDEDSPDSNNEENFNTKILKSFNKEFKHQSR
jgi:hypothetical protein